MEVIYKLINELLEADKLGKQKVATDNLIKGIEHYANQRVIEELKKAWEEIEKDFYLTSAVYFERRIKELKLGKDV